MGPEDMSTGKVLFLSEVLFLSQVSSNIKMSLESI